jgi:amino acid adenylation domain-containing protein
VKFDLTLSFLEKDGKFQGSMEYSSELFSEKTIDRMVGHYVELLQHILKDSRTLILNLPLVTYQEREQILIEWNATQREYFSKLCLHQLVEQQAEQTPQRIAVVFEGDQISYEKLNAKSNQLAHYLRSRGVGPDVPVGVCIERSLNLVIGLLGVLKAGGAYVPLDPSYPSFRLESMASQASLPLLITESSLTNALSTVPTPTVLLDEEWAKIACENQRNPINQVSRESLAYIMFTSGSTGIPKGVMITHGGICNRILWMQEAFGLTTEDRVLQKTPFSFDVSVWEFFWPLITGACLVVAKPGGHRDSGYLVNEMATQKITTVHFVPPQLQILIEEPDFECCGTLRRVICSGEELPVSLQSQFFEKNGAELHNLFGPTEAAVDVTAWKCKIGHSESLVPIGRPIANTLIYVLDSWMNPVPVGVVGELFIGGCQLARGYIGQPDLTAEKFLPHPFSPDPGARLYRTGDLGRFREDGVIEFLGRSDHQVKLRGFRIELGEIETALGQLSGVQKAVVVYHGLESREKRLIAYVACSPSTSITPDFLREALQETLPDYMRPSTFVMLEALPLTPNGKVYRRGLPVPDLKISGCDDNFVVPRSEMEIHLSRIWQENLGISQVGLYDNFFDLGGHSLLSMKVLLQIREELGIRINPNELITQTLGQLAVYCEREKEFHCAGAPIEYLTRMSLNFKSWFS